MGPVLSKPSVTVWLKSGSPPMTVSSSHALPGLMVAEWLDDAMVVHRDVFDLASLTTTAPLAPTTAIGSRNNVAQTPDPHNRPEKPKEGPSDRGPPRHGETEPTGRNILAWAISTFGEDVATDRRERTMRFIEEAIEVAHAEDVPHVTVARILARVYDRDREEFAKIHEAVMATSPNFYNVSRAVALTPALVVE
jgi:uncharacterized protein YodC (DUF2158 family)